ncbi:MAG: DUF4277 domain-containing protein [Bacillota bacterium]|nr:DUF4277 domain-containing protein [Bacillota bacterium]
MSPEFNPARREAKNLSLSMVVANRCLDEIGFARIVDEHISWDPKQWHVSPGSLLHVLALLTSVNGLTPLETISKRLKEMDVEQILGGLVQAERVNEYNVGEALERFGRTNPEKLYSLVLMAAMAHFEVYPARLHTDTANLAFGGTYDSGDKPVEKHQLLELAFNREPLSGCRHSVSGQIVNEREIQMLRRVINAAASNIQYSAKTTKLLEKLQELAKSTVFVADGEQISEKYIRRLTQQGFFFVSRCPKTFADNLCDRAKTAVLAEGELLDLGTFSENKGSACYRGRSIWMKANPDLSVRLLVFTNDQLMARAEPELQAMRKKVEASTKAVKKKVFKCQSDAEEEVERMRQNPAFRYFDVDVEYIEEEHVRWPRGRRGANTKPVEITTTVRVDFEEPHPQEEHVQEYRKMRGSLVLISNVPEEHCEDRDLLASYADPKEHENIFRQLELPSLSTTLYLQNEDRKKGLVIVLHVALLIHTIIELKLRRELAEWQEESAQANN